MAFVLLPHQAPHWKAIKHTLTHVLDERLTIFQLISHLDCVENLTHFGELTDHLLDDLPRRKTFFNLGSFLCGLSSNELHHFQNSILPFLLRCVIDLEHLCPEYLLCSRTQKEYDTFVPFHLVTAVIACAFLCLLRTRWNSVSPFDEVNFTKFFERLTDTRFNHGQKLFSLITYFDHCRQSTVTNAPAVLHVIRRHLSVHFVNGYVSGNCLVSAAPQEASPFWLFPDLLACLPICHPLEEFEALWVDHYRGPFLPKQTVSDYTLKWRRLAIMNSSNLPCWASDRQFLESYVLDEVMKATAALFGLGLSNLTRVCG
ncbi:uncharacterized protein DEA37_0014767 [Paragonimus westermani]|uniref:PARG helical domain-containing protein n=1 Tax=Paragonimus westermani TaxID=34504 RepID=A0A5J4NP85_9TREM|nr:uncharacterized protein DEA37_0014767 [Paragonimus westermani]